MTLSVGRDFEDGTVGRNGGMRQSMREASFETSKVVSLELLACFEG